MAKSTNHDEKLIVEIVNRKARFQYQFIDQYEAGISLKGTEVKSIRSGHVNLSDAYCLFKNGELTIRSLYIKEYKFGNQENHEARRIRKLLLRKDELRRLEKKVKQRGFTIIPYRLYINSRGLAKIEIVLAQGKKSFDKRNSLKEKEQKRSLDRLKKQYT